MDSLVTSTQLFDILLMADSRVPEVVVEEEDESNEQFVDAEEKGFLSSTAVQQDALKSTSSAGRLSHKFWISAAINTVSTAAIVNHINLP